MAIAVGLIFVIGYGIGIELYSITSEQNRGNKIDSSLLPES